MAIEVPSEPDIESKSPINPWVRADQGRHNEETKTLIPEYLHEDYERMVGQVATCGAIYSQAQEVAFHAQENLMTAQQELADFFRWLAYPKESANGGQA